MDHGGGGRITDVPRAIDTFPGRKYAKVRARQGDLQGTFRGPSGDLQGTFRGPSGDLQGTFRGPSGDLQGTFRGPSDDQDDHGPTVFDRLLFFNMFKNSSRSLFRYPTLGGLRRSRQIFPRRYRVVRDSARRFPTIFAKMRPIDQKKDRVLSGPKQSLVKWPL